MNQASIPAPSDTLLKAFVGSNDGDEEDYYLKCWEGLRTGKSFYAGFNFWAAFAPEYWCIYRQLYGLGFALLGLIITSSYTNFGDFYGLSGDAGEWTATLVLSNLAFRLACAFGANILLYQKACRVIHSLGEDTNAERVSEAGGARPKVMGAAIVITAALIALKWFL